jgi:hypothetical protein
MARGDIFPFIWTLSSFEFDATHDKRMLYAVDVTGGGRVLAAQALKHDADLRKLAIIMHRIWADGSEFCWSREEGDRTTIGETLRGTVVPKLTMPDFIRRPTKPEAGRPGASAGAEIQTLPGPRVSALPLPLGGGSSM